MPADLGLKTMNTVHRLVLRTTGGRVGWNLLRMPVLELTTTGRKTGRRHSVMLTSPLQLGETYVVVASRGGDDRSPAWFLNLEADPKVEVAINGQPAEPRLARVATPAEREELWPRLTRDHQNYAGYQKKTSRVIPVVLLEPAS